MKIISVDVQNYGAFQGRHLFKLSDRGLCIVLGDNQDEPRMNSNGAGKSTLFDALDWCLFGKIPREDHADSIINERAGKDCVVIVTLIDDDREATITRGRAPKKVTFDLAGQRQLAPDGQPLDDSETQRLIEQFLGLDRDVFHAAVLFGQTDLLRFADATDSKRVEILTKILQLEEIDEWLDRAKLKRNEATEVWTRTNGIVANLNGQIQALEAQDFTQDAANWDSMRADRLRQAILEINQYLESITKAKGVVEHEPKVLASEQQAITEQRHTVLDLSDFDKKLTELRASESETQSLKGRIAYEIQTASSQLEKWQTKGEGICSECGQVITADHRHKEIETLEVSKGSAQNNLQIANQSLGGLQEMRTKIDAQREDQRLAHYEADKENNRIWQEVQGQKKIIEEAKAYLSKAEPYVVTMRTNMETVRTEVNPFHDRQQRLEGERSRLRFDLQRVMTDTELAHQAIDYYEFWVTGFGPKGLKSYIMDTKLTELTNAANEWVHLLTGGTIWIRFETQTKGRTTKKLSNKTNIRVFRYNPDGSITERNYRSWSGGEKERVSLGIDLGMSRLIAKRAQKQYDVLIFDELFKHLDQAGREAVMDMLKVLRREKSSVIVVDHDSEFCEAFENRVVVRKQNGESTIDESDSRIPGLSDHEGRGSVVEVGDGTIQPPGSDAPPEKTQLAAF